MDMNIEDITNKNLYEFCHAEDLQKLRKAHIDCKYKFIETYSSLLIHMHLLLITIGPIRGDSLWRVS